MPHNLSAEGHWLLNRVEKFTITQLVNETCGKKPAVRSLLFSVNKEFSLFA